MNPLTVARLAFGALPPTVKEFYYRADSAIHESTLIDWLCDDQREGGPAGFIGMAISARMSPALREAREAVDDKSWNRSVAFLLVKSVNSRKPAEVNLQPESMCPKNRASLGGGGPTKIWKELTASFQVPPGRG